MNAMVTALKMLKMGDSTQGNAVADTPEDNNNPQAGAQPQAQANGGFFWRLMHPGGAGPTPRLSPSPTPNPSPTASPTPSPYEELRKSRGGGGTRNVNYNSAASEALKALEDSERNGGR